MFFKCTSRLVPVFKEVYGNTFRYEKNRALIFSEDDLLPLNELGECIEMALTYHMVKHLEHLGRTPI
ncbi:MAG: hypothetical protein WBA17_05145 [Saprospiraceae bacterium]